MKFIFPFGYFIWIFSEIILNRFMRSKTADKKNIDKNSLAFIWITIVVTITLAVYISMNYYLPLSTHYIIRYVGLLLIYVGVFLRLFIIKSLGQFFTVDVTIRQNHTLKKDGFYKYLRHPSYFASLISFVGFGLSLNNWISLLIIIVSILIAFINRIKVEEKALIEHFGGEYIQYKKSTKGLIPFLY